LPERVYDYIKEHGLYSGVSANGTAL
jgi:lipid-binding SYLF domain-containing protein